MRAGVTLVLVMLACSRGAPVRPDAVDIDAAAAVPTCDDLGEHVFHVLVTSAPEETKKQMLIDKDALVGQAVARCKQMSAAERDCVLRAWDLETLGGCAGD